jgi:hypothetical protein
LVKVAAELHLLLAQALVAIQASTHQQHMAAAVAVVHTVELRQIGLHLAVVGLQLDCLTPQKLQQQLAAAAEHMVNVVLVVVEQAGYQRQHQEILELAEHKLQAVPAVFQTMVTQEQSVLHSKAEIREMKVAAAVVVTSAAAVVVTTLAVLADLVTLHF